MTALLALCDVVTEKRIRPIRAELTCSPSVHPEAYREMLGAPIRFDADVGALHFDKVDMQAPLLHGTPDIAKATDRIAEQYIEALDPHKVASQVRRLLIDLLPSGKVGQELVSSRLNRSASTLQRQLQGEGLTYREVLVSTQRNPNLFARQETHPCANRLSPGFLRPEQFLQSIQALDVNESTPVSGVPV